MQNNVYNGPYNNSMPPQYPQNNRNTYTPQPSNGAKGFPFGPVPPKHANNPNQNYNPEMPMPKNSFPMGPVSFNNNNTYSSGGYGGQPQMNQGNTGPGMPPKQPQHPYPNSGQGPPRKKKPPGIFVPSKRPGPPKRP